MDDSTAVLDAPELEAEEVEGSEGSEGEGSESGEQSQKPTEREEQTEDEPSIIEADGKLKLSGKALETLNKLKADNPKQAREFRAALFDAATLRKEFPDGIREAVQLKQELEDIGGMEAVGTMRGELDAWKGLDADWTGKKPQFSAEMAESNPEAFAFHAPHIMSKFAEVAPDDFTYHVAKVFAADMASNDVVMTGRMLENAIFDEQDKIRPGMEQIARLWSPLAKYIGRIGQLAKTPPQQKDKPNDGKPSTDVDQREQALTVREFSTERNAVKNSITEAEFKKNLGTRKLAADKASTIRELYDSALNRAVQATPKHKETVDRYVAAKDRAGYRKYMDGVIRKSAPGAMSAAFRRAGVGDKPGPKKVDAKPAGKPGTATVTTNFNRVGAKPSSNDVDWQATARIAGKKGGDGKYILRDGSKVLFQR